MFLINKLLVFIVLFCVALSAFADSVRDGIWQGKDTSDYYSIHTSDSTLILIDLSKIARSKKTLSGAYYGYYAKNNFEKSTLTKFSLEDEIGDYISFYFTSATEACFYADADAVNSVLFCMKKVF